MRKKCILFVTVMSLFIVLVFSGCADSSDSGIEGTWILVEEINSDGSKISQSDLQSMGISEEYVIVGDTAQYTCTVPQMKKPVKMFLTVKEVGKNEYDLNISDDFTFATVKVKGDKMTYDVKSEDGHTTMVFKRKK